MTPDYTLEIPINDPHRKFMLAKRSKNVNFDQRKSFTTKQELQEKISHSSC